MITDGDLRLRPANLDDAYTALPWYSDPEVLRYSEGITEPYDISTVTRMYRYLLDNGELYVIEIIGDDGWKPIGDVCLMKDSLPIVIGEPRFRSSGIGGRVISLLICRAKDLGWKELRIKHIYEYNIRSIRLFTSAGFVCTGERTESNGVREFSYSMDISH